MTALRATATLQFDGTYEINTHSAPPVRASGATFEEAARNAANDYRELVYSAIDEGRELPHKMTPDEYFVSPDYVVGGVKGSSYNFNLRLSDN